MNTRTVMTLVAVVLVAAAATYWFAQKVAPVDDTSHAAVAPASQGSSDGKIASVSDLVGGLEARLEEDKDDAKGWLLLARSYDHLGDNENALRAYIKAVELGLSDAQMEMKLVQNAFDEDSPR